MGKAVKPLTKSQIISELAEQSGLTKKDVTAVLEAMSGLITTAVSKKGPGQFTIPNLCKIVVKVKPATKKPPSSQPADGRDEVGRSEACQPRHSRASAQGSQGHGGLIQAPRSGSSRPRW